MNVIARAARGLLMAAALVSAGAASAATIHYAGGGTINSISSSTLQATGSADVGDAFSFGVDFDLASATAIYLSDDLGVWAQPVNNFSAMLGAYDFKLGVDAETPVILLVSREFQFLGGTSSEAVRRVGFYFPGLAIGATPFDLGMGAKGDLLALTAIFRDRDPQMPISLADVIDPRSALIRSFDYEGSDGEEGDGSLRGSFAASFATAEAVPEPEVWMMMILGFGLVGGNLRIRRTAQASAA